LYGHSSLLFYSDSFLDDLTDALLDTSDNQDTDITKNSSEATPKDAKPSAKKKRQVNHLLNHLKKNQNKIGG
jgi:hypothetical protein